MTTITYDYFKRLEQVGFSHEQADVLISLTGEVATKAEVKEELQILEKDLTHKIELSESRVESAIKGLKIELLQEIQMIRLELGGGIHSVKSEVRFIKGLCVFIAGVILTTGILFGMIKFFL